jgi:hypothetical protein
MDICTLLDGIGEGMASTAPWLLYASVNRGLTRQKMTMFGEEAVNQI